jgi:predicted histone-like DNA-binding protein
MSVFYKLLQSKNNRSVTFGKWYARAVHYNTVTTAQLAKEMQANCTVKESDIKAVLAEMVETMQRQLQNSNAVKIDGLGTFKIGINSKGAEKPEEFDSSNIRDVHILFCPETHVERNGNRLRALLTGTKVMHLKQYTLPESEDEGDDVEP